MSVPSQKLLARSMKGPVVPEAVKRFLLARIDSVAQLEALLLMRRNRPRRWTADELAGQLYIRPREGADVLSALLARGLATQLDGAFRYRPESPEVEALVDELAETYREKLIPITNFIHQQAKRPADRFADAFQFRKED